METVKFWNNITTDPTLTGCDYMDWIFLARVNVMYRLVMFREQ